MGSEKFCLRWNDFETNISSAFRELRDDKDFFDVTLACDDEQIQAHKVILSACSPFFRNILRRNPHQHPLLYLKGVKYTDLQSVLNFMYHGEVNVAQEELNSFLAVAEDLRVKGLTQNQSGSSSSRAKETYSTSKPQQDIPKARAPPDPTPPPKRSRPTPPVSSYSQDDDIQEVVPVKTEPRDHVPTPAPVEMYHSDPSPAVHHVTPATVQPSHASQQSQQLQQMDDSMQYAGDESYDDYGQYGADGGYDGAMVEPGMASLDNNKGLIISNFGQSLEEVTSENCEKSIDGFICKVCGITVKDFYAAKNHMEAKHFNSHGGYRCEHCNKSCATRNAYSCHKSRCLKKSRTFLQ